MSEKKRDMQDKQKENILQAFSQAMGDPVRLKIAGRMAIQPQSTAELGSSLNLPVDQIQQHLDQLVEIGLAHLENNRYQLDGAALAAWVKMVHAANKQVSPVADLELGDAFERKTLRDFLHADGTIKAFPAQEKKFLVLVRYTLQVFEPGVRYTEKQVNELLRRYHSDTAQLRRSMVDYGYMKRQDGVYWRLEP